MLRTDLIYIVRDRHDLETAGFSPDGVGMAWADDDGLELADAIRCLKEETGITLTVRMDDDDFDMLREF